MGYWNLQQLLLNCVSLFISVNFYFTYFGAVRCSYNFVLLMGWPFYHYQMSLFILVTFFVLYAILSDISIPSSAFLWLMFVYLFPFFYFPSLNLLNLWCLSNGQHIVWSCFFIQFDNLYILIRLLIRSHLMLLITGFLYVALLIPLKCFLLY